ncbi:sodium/potassium-transporting ATPase subunit gamma [Sinocyclocheilus grahami]|uniref:sodium/potassium-transporting ATPase subunit gamma n=1 Tax=Sinocyclocheilus grahami TaxID=75366 RepID=UPI0007ACA76D|nr:PREDICTED: sodium/potassium-transporting ATPase subunit gamma-like [Sinocyclocheilus grahami]
MGVEKPEYSDADFTYDYELIRRGGLIFAAVLFCLGMAIIFSKKLNCGNKVSAKPEDNGYL